MTGRDVRAALWAAGLPQTALLPHLGLSGAQLSRLLSAGMRGDLDERIVEAARASLCPPERVELVLVEAALCLPSEAPGLVDDMTSRGVLADVQDAWVTDGQIGAVNVLRRLLNVEA